MPYDERAAIAVLESRLTNAPRVEGADGFAIDLRATVWDVLRAADADALVVPRYEDTLAREARYQALLPLVVWPKNAAGMALRVTVDDGLVRTTVMDGSAERLAGYANRDTAHLLGLAYCSAAAQTIREAG